MTAARPAGAQQDVCQFLCVYVTATFTFGMLADHVKARSEHRTKQMSGSFDDLAQARTELEDGLRESIESESHNCEAEQMQMGMMLVAHHDERCRKGRTECEALSSNSRTHPEQPQPVQHDDQPRWTG